MSRSAVFLDRDGTIIRDAHFIGKPELVELLPGVAAALRRLNDAGRPVVVVTNQSGIARGYFTEADYDRVRRQLDSLIAAPPHGARIDATYMCPHHPERTGPCACRKPGTLLFHRAAAELDLDLARSWYIGDKLRDVRPAAELGAKDHGILIPTGDTPSADIEAARREFQVVGTLDEAVDRAIESAP